MLTILVICGAILEGSKLGVDFYIGSVNATKFSEPAVWKDAVSLNKNNKKKFKKF